MSVATGAAGGGREGGGGVAAKPDSRECRLHRVDIKRRWDAVSRNLRVHFHFKCADTSPLASSPRFSPAKHDAISRNETLSRGGYQHSRLQKDTSDFD